MGAVLTQLTEQGEEHPILYLNSTPTRAASDAAQPLFDPPRNLATRPEDEGRDALNLHASGDQRILLSQNSGL
ncbi:hypothetical protein TNCV_810751 [Trichonephila clavipes]|uniref:Uncharacterized protein n=1 Tax=Trichonephila clavipes TaxID=2585209 RepID=A0A8X6S713_TRICX|nr:hypothetical protein TNCV_810751 [Trichonephila clavipes]